MMDFFLSKTDSTATPARLKYFVICDPQLAGEEDDPDNNSDQLLVYLSNEEQDIDINTKIRRIGLITGMNDFCVGFDKNKADDEENEDDGLKCVELDDSRILLERFEDRYNFIISIDLTKIEEDDGKTITYDKSIPLKFYSNLIIEGYNEFRLHHGKIESLYETMERSEFVDYLERWFIIWFKNYQLELIEDGFLKNFNSFYQKSNLKLDSELNNTINEEILNFSKFKEFLIWNNSANDIGLVYQHFNNLDYDSKIRLLKWLKLVNYYGLSTNSLLSSNILKLSKTDKDPEVDKRVVTPFNENVYDPFKLVYETISDVSKKSGITSGVNYGFKTMASGLSTVNSYIPWGFTGNETTTIPEAAASETDPVAPTRKVNSSNEPQFLIGKISDNSIVYMNLYLKFNDEEEESLHRLVIFKYDKKLIILIYKFNSNELNDVNFYDELFVKLNKLSRFHFGNDLLINNERKKKNFHFIGIDKNSKFIKTNLPNIPQDDIFDANDDELIEEVKLNDLSLNKLQCQLIHKELTNLFNDFKNSFFKKKLKIELKEKLIITKNGWWIYNINNQDKIIFILKRSKKSHKKYLSNYSLLDISANVNDILGKEAKEWVNNFFNGY